MSNVTRRDFLKLSTIAGLALAGAHSASRAVASPVPFKRTGQPRLRLSLAAYSFRNSFPVMQGKAKVVPPGKATDMFKFIDYCGAQGCEGAELTSYFFTEESDEYLLKLRRHAFLAGVAISGTAIGNNFSHPKGPQRDAEIATTKRWIDHAAVLGAPHIRVFAGVAKQLSRPEADKLVISALEECGAYAGQKGIFLGLENHDSIQKAAALLPMVKAVSSPWVGINLDSGNFRTADPYKDFAECVPYTVNVQFKTDMGEPPPAGPRPADLKRLTRILRDHGYQGWVALEYEAKEDPATAIPPLLQEMKALFAAA